MEGYEHYKKIASNFNNIMEAHNYGVAEVEKAINYWDSMPSFSNNKANDIMGYIQYREKQAIREKNKFLFIIYSEIEDGLKLYMKNRFYKDYSLWEKIKFYFL